MDTCRAHSNRRASEKRLAGPRAAWHRCSGATVVYSVLVPASGRASGCLITGLTDEEWRILAVRRWFVKQGRERHVQHCGELGHDGDGG